MLHGYGPFRREQIVDGLLDQAYAVVARSEDDVERSNGVGKSTLLSAVRFALTGWHPWRVDDEAITWGENRARVEVLFDDGSLVTREKTRGKSVQVRFARQNEPLLSQAEAEKAIARTIGLDADDFLGACVLEQKRISKFVDLESSDLLAFLSSWFKLDRLDKAQDAASSAGAALERELEACEREVVAARALFSDALGELTLEQLQGEIANAERSAEKAEERLASEHAIFESAAERRRSWRDAERLREIIAEGQALAAVETPGEEILQARVQKALKAEAEAGAAESRAKDGQRAALRIVRGEFDGQCPVVGAACPAREQVEGMRGEARKKAELEEGAAIEAGVVLRKAREATAAANRELAEHRDRTAKLERLRRERDALLASARTAPDEEPNVERESAALTAARGELSNERARVEVLRDRQRRATRAGATLDAALAKSGEVSARLRVARAGGVVLRETTRRVAEGRMGEIARRATGAMARAGLSLEVLARWERETSDLAHACRACGAPFPRSRGVKECACGEPRGKHYERKPAFVPSRRSGGLDDLAGIYLQLSLGAWLRRERGSEFSLALVDEGTASLDRALRKVFATSIVSAIRDVAGCRQALIVSHDAATLDALPGRIEVFAGRDGFAVAQVRA